MTFWKCNMIQSNYNCEKLLINKNKEGIYMCAHISMNEILYL